MKICITGASGFIGKNFLLKADKHWDIYAFYHTKDQDFLDFLKENKLDSVKPYCVNFISYLDIQKIDCWSIDINSLKSKLKNDYDKLGTIKQ